MSLSICLVDPPSPFRNELRSTLEARGTRVDLWDDALSALASSEEIAADVIAVGDDNEVTASSLVRLLERRAKGARIYRLTGDTGEAPLPTSSPRVARSFGAAAVADTLLRTSSTGADGFASDVAVAQLGQLLIWLHDRHETGVLLLQAEGYEREIALILGVPVHARSTQPSERLGAIAVKQGLIQPDQLDAALTHARACGTLLGKALIELGLIEAPALFALLARQTREQLEAACAAGPFKARFRPDPRIPEQLDLYPVHPMAALLGAASRVPAAVLASTLDRAAGRGIAEHARSEAITGWLRSLGLVIDAKAATVGALRTAIAAQLAPSGQAQADALVLALVAAGTRVGEATRAPGAAPSLPPPVGASLMRVLDARAPYKQPLHHAPELGSPRDDWQRALHATLLAPVPGDASDALVVKGPEDEAISDPLRALYVLHKIGRDPFETIGVGHAASQAEIDLAYCARLEALDSSSAASTAATTALRKVELRRAFDRAHAVLTQRAAAGAQTRATPGPPIGRASSTSLAEPSPAGTTSLDPTAATELEPLIRKANWHEVASWIEQKYPGGTGLSPALSLIYAVALKEAPSDGARAPLAAQADVLGVRALSGLLGVSEDSALALVIAKRALRTRPLEWQKAPPKRVSITLMLIALIVGAAVGLALSQQSLPFHW